MDNSRWAMEQEPHQQGGQSPGLTTPHQLPTMGKAQPWPLQTNTPRYPQWKEPSTEHPTPALQGYPQWTEPSSDHPTPAPRDAHAGQSLPLATPHQHPQMPTLGSPSLATPHQLSRMPTMDREPIPAHPTPAPQDAHTGQSIPGQPMPAPWPPAAGRQQPRHARPRPREQPTTTNSCVSHKGKNSARKQYSARLFPSPYCK